MGSSFAEDPKRDCSSGRSRHQARSSANGGNETLVGKPAWPDQGFEFRDAHRAVFRRHRIADRAMVFSSTTILISIASTNAAAAGRTVWVCLQTGRFARRRLLTTLALGWVERRGRVAEDVTVRRRSTNSGGGGGRRGEAVTRSVLGWEAIRGGIPPHPTIWEARFEADFLRRILSLDLSVSHSDPILAGRVFGNRSPFGQRVSKTKSGSETRFRLQRVRAISCSRFAKCRDLFRCTPIRITGDSKRRSCEWESCRAGRLSGFVHPRRRSNVPSAGPRPFPRWAQLPKLGTRLRFATASRVVR